MGIGIPGTMELLWPLKPLDKESLDWALMEAELEFAMAMASDPCCPSWQKLWGEDRECWYWWNCTEPSRPRPTAC